MRKKKSTPPNGDPGIDEAWIPGSEEERSAMLVKLRKALERCELKIEETARQKGEVAREYWQAKAYELQLMRRIRQVEREGVSPDDGHGESHTDAKH